LNLKFSFRYCSQIIEDFLDSIPNKEWSLSFDAFKGPSEYETMW